MARTRSTARIGPTAGLGEVDRLDAANADRGGRRESTIDRSEVTVMARSLPIQSTDVHGVLPDDRGILTG